MANAQKILYRGSVVAIIFPHNIPVTGVQFFTGADNPFQIGLHNRMKGTVLPPHGHRLDKPLTITSIQEILFVKSGKVRVSLYAPQGTVIKQKILLSGDSVLLLEVIHGVEFLEDSQIFEVKQGPYPGQSIAKKYLRFANNQKHP